MAKLPILNAELVKRFNQNAIRITGERNMKATISGKDELYRFYYNSDSLESRGHAFQSARNRKRDEPDSTVIVCARDQNESYRVYLDTELIPRLEKL